MPLGRSSEGVPVPGQLLVHDDVRRDQMEFDVSTRQPSVELALLPLFRPFSSRPGLSQKGGFETFAIAASGRVLVLGHIHP